MISYVDSSVDHYNHADMTEHEMYISTSDDQIRIELTEEKMIVAVRWHIFMSIMDCVMKHLRKIREAH